MGLQDALMGQAMANATPPPSQYSNVGNVLKQLMQTHAGLAGEQRQAYREDQQSKLKAGLEQRKDTMSILSDELKSMRTQLGDMTDPNDPNRAQLQSKVDAYERALSQLMDVDVSTPQQKLGFDPKVARVTLKKAGSFDNFVKSIMQSEDIEEDAKTLFIDWAKKQATRQERWTSAPDTALQAGMGTAAGAVPGAVLPPGMGMLGTAAKGLLSGVAPSMNTGVGKGLLGNR